MRICKDGRIWGQNNKEARGHLGILTKGACRRKGTASICKMGELNPNWKGDIVKYVRVSSYLKLHRYMNKIIPKPELCSCCGKMPPYDLSNINGDYTRDPDGWEWICRKCHLLKDGRINNLRSYQW